MNNNEIEDFGKKDISLIPIEIVTRDRTPKTIRDAEYNIIINLRPTADTHWFLVIKRDH